ncbi:exodeoxyribonuclease VII large subunit [Litorivita pollutaquae]|uniref:Exodeoxyribonuclease 7 large subunit n=1 Tax=Litorivita pollutaquae TaxID=2200892 RepID=A0A2V4MTI7_9RHOB|nr:exodeoxyribonuclease VII large subunit [Litorivita pollutaquae]PYC48819.1 exodeoxyribonuclease VII large subunit [Litorivita pollutaquae]
MSDLLDDPTPGQNAPEFSVTEISGAIKRVIEGEFAHVRIRAEIGRCSFPRSGHVYLDLKDDKSVISAVMWKGVAARIATRPEEGMEVVATGRITTFGGQSKYQLVIEDIKPAGVGALMAMLEKRKEKLAGEGLFDQSCKKPLPYLPEVIGVVTSPSGAVIRDILHRLRDRFPRKVLIWPVAVQGEKCPADVVRAIEGFNAMSAGGALPRPDLIIVARGGGSLEDLWGFNDEGVARAAAASDIPLISAVGHETDTTLIDFTSDRRAPTPTAAAEMAVPVRHELLAWLGDQEARMGRALSDRLAQRGQRLRDLSRAMPRADTLMDGPRQRLDTWGERLPAALLRVVQGRRVTLADAGASLRPSVLHSAVARKREALGRRSDKLNITALTRDISRKRADFTALQTRMAGAAQRQIDGWRGQVETTDRMRETLSYKATLARGYAVVRGKDGVVTGVGAARAAGILEIEFADGRMIAGQGDADKAAASAAPAKAVKPKKSKTVPKPAPKKSSPEQGSLF